MFSFRLKIVVSLVTLSLLSFVIGAYNTRSVLLGLFDYVILDRSSDDFRFDVSAYYHLYGSWDAALEVETFEQYRERAGRPVTHQTFGSPPPFIATDLDGKIRIPSTHENTEYKMGLTVSESDLEGAIPLRSRGTPIGFALPDGEMPPNEIEEQYLQGLRNTWWVSLLIVAGASIPLGYFLGGRLTQPIHHLIAAISKMSPSNLNQQVPVNSKDELGMLSKSFNQMSSDLADFVELIKHQREQISETENMLRQGLVSVSHELRTPLYTSVSQAQAMLDGIRALDHNEMEKLAKSLDYLTRLVDDLYRLSLADVKALHCDEETVDFAALVKNKIAVRSDEFASRGFIINASLPEQLEVEGDSMRLSQIVDNLLTNCYRYTDQDAEIDIQLTEKDQKVELVVSDSGPGTPPESLDSLFDRFYRVDPSRSRATGGAGLGLSLVKTYAQVHGGSAEAFHSEKGGLGIRVHILKNTFSN